jgi:hypothetical protein
MSQKSLVSKSVKAASVSTGTEIKVPTVNVSDLPPRKGAVMYNIFDNQLYVGTGTSWKLASSTITAASLGLASTQAAPGLHTIMFDKSLLPEGTPLYQPNQQSPIFTSDGSGVLTCQRGGVYKIELATLLSHIGAVFPYLLTLSIVVSGSGLAADTDVSVLKTTVSASAVVQLELSVGQTVTMEVITSAPSPTLLTTGTNVLITQID